MKLQKIFLQKEKRARNKHVTKEFLKKEWNRAMEESVTPNCKVQCNACGAARFGCGICFEERSVEHEVAN